MLNEPLHDTQVVHHLHECNEEDDCAQNVGEEPELVEDGVLIEEENSPDPGFL